MLTVSHLVLGIDPGMKGGLAIFAPGATIPVVQPLPITSGRWVDCRAIVELLGGIIDWSPMDTLVFIERVWALPQQGGMEKFIKNAGMLLGLCQTMGFMWREVLPKEWKYALLPNVGEHGKAEAIAYCKQNYPSVSLMATPRSKKEHDGMADAICIADYGRKLLCGKK